MPGTVTRVDAEFRMSEADFQHHRNIHVPSGGVWIDIGGGASFDGLLDPKPGVADSEIAPDPVAFFPLFRPGDGQVRAEPNWIHRLGGAIGSTSTRLLVLMIEMKRSGQSVNGAPGVSTIFGLLRAPLAINLAKNRSSIIRAI